MTIKGYKEKVVPDKSEKEQELNKIYMPYIRLHGVIPNEIVEAFLKDLESLKNKHTQYS